MEAARQEPVPSDRGAKSQSFLQIVNVDLTIAREPCKSLRLLSRGPCRSQECSVRHVRPCSCIPPFLLALAHGPAIDHEVECVASRSTRLWLHILNRNALRQFRHAIFAPSNLSSGRRFDRNIIVYSCLMDLSRGMQTCSHGSTFWRQSATVKLSKRLHRTVAAGPQLFVTAHGDACCGVECSLASPARCSVCERQPSTTSFK